MTTYIGLLRAINLAGRNMVAMGPLRDMLAGLGFSEPRSLLQSGNVLFQCRPRGAAQLEKMLEAELKKTFAVDTDFMIRTADEWGAMVERNPFPKEARSDPGHLLAFCMKDTVSAGGTKTLQAAIKGREVVRTDGRHAYIYYPDGVGRSKLTSTLIEKHLGTRGTARNWNTVLKLLELAEPATP